MINKTKSRLTLCVFISLISFNASATDSIKVKVSTKESKAAAIGFSVEGVKSGGIGKSHSGKGPINKEYFFGYKKDSVFGDNVSCGSLILDRDSTITLLQQDGQCISILN